MSKIAISKSFIADDQPIHIHTDVPVPLISWPQISQNICASLDTARRYKQKKVGIAIRTGLKMTGCHHNWYSKSISKVMLLFISIPPPKKKQLEYEVSFLLLICQHLLSTSTSFKKTLLRLENSAVCKKSYARMVVVPGKAGPHEPDILWFYPEWFSVWPIITYETKVSLCILTEWSE